MKNFHRSLHAISALIVSLIALQPLSSAVLQERRDTFNYDKYLVDAEPYARLKGNALEAYWVARQQHRKDHPSMKLADYEVAFFDAGPYYRIQIYARYDPKNPPGLGNSNPLGPERLYLIDKKTLKLRIVRSLG